VSYIVRYMQGSPHAMALGYNAKTSGYYLERIGLAVGFTTLEDAEVAIEHFIDANPNAMSWREDFRICHVPYTVTTKNPPTLWDHLLDDDSYA
jgi:hypothetical protein